MPPRVAFLVEDGFADLELFYPKYRLVEAGAEPVMVTPDGKPRTAEKGFAVTHPEAAGEIAATDFAALMLPGGVASVDRLRLSEDAVGFVRDFVRGTDGPVFAMGHGPWLLADADAVDGVELTSWWSLRPDLERAGATWRDAPVVTHGRFVTARMPPDLPQFGRAVVEALAARAPADARASKAAR